MQQRWALHGERLMRSFGIELERRRRSGSAAADDAPVYTGIGWNFASHSTVQHAEKEYVR